MSNIDDQIRAALDDDDRKAMAELDSGDGVFDLITNSLKGKQAWFTGYLFLISLVITIFGIFLIVTYLDTTDLSAKLDLALLILGCGLAITAAKLCSFIQMIKLEILRELKRVEMRVMLVDEKSKK